MIAQVIQLPSCSRLSWNYKPMIRKNKHSKICTACNSFILNTTVFRSLKVQWKWYNLEVHVAWNPQLSSIYKCNSVKKPAARQSRLFSSAHIPWKWLQLSNYHSCWLIYRVVHLDTNLFKIRRAFSPIDMQTSADTRETTVATVLNKVSSWNSVRLASLMIWRNKYFLLVMKIRPCILHYL